MSSDETNSPAAQDAEGWEIVEKAREACFAAEALLFERRISSEPAGLFLKQAWHHLQTLKGLGGADCPDFAIEVAEKCSIETLDVSSSSEASKCLKQLRRGLRKAEKHWVATHGANRVAKRRRLFQNAKIGVVAAAVTALVISLWPAPYELGWRGTYYNMPYFQGDARVRVDDVLNFRWGKSNPMEAFPKDKFTVRWETCLEVPKDMDVRFQLGSDDGSRLYVNGKKLVNFWGKHRFGYKQKKTKLKKGFHYLRVDYMEAASAASIELRAGFDGKVPLPIKPSLVRIPNGDKPFKDKCKNLNL